MMRYVGFPGCRAWIASLLILPVGIPLVSCVAEPPTHEVVVEGNIANDDVYVREEPPPPREEVEIGSAPGPSYIWVGGYWSWYQSNWYWVRGRWAARPEPNAHWVPGHWQHLNRSYRWNPGHWRR